VGEVAEFVRSLVNLAIAPFDGHGIADLLGGVGGVDAPNEAVGWYVQCYFRADERRNRRGDEG